MTLVLVRDTIEGAMLFNDGQMSPEHFKLSEVIRLALEAGKTHMLTIWHNKPEGEWSERPIISLTRIDEVETEGQVESLEALYAQHGAPIIMVACNWDEFTVWGESDGL